ncbi:single strand binding protein [Mycoplasmopsis maculosa]|uniref:Single-stranded DNA-binding protein n=1 Tax=Mycoplasmopsis maculosa TaxID=114885 RepID=A0A449B3W9_9BACT|nr:single-stranded DNA-binding protein [Mycoplasmopsis maculosa]VEU75287.1 single strand binding protein [Mycoplasmopsis maculosa]
MNYNKTFLIGRIAREINFFQNSSGISTARSVIAVNRNIASDRQMTDFIPIVAFEKQAFLLKNYAFKGTLLAIEGSNIVNSTKQNDKTIINMEVKVDNIEFLESKNKQNQKNNNIENDYKKEFLEKEFDNKNSINEPTFSGLDKPDSNYKKIYSFQFDEDE